MSYVETNLECLFIILENYKLNVQDIGFSRLQRIYSLLALVVKVLLMK